MIEITPFASGSRGNCYRVTDGRTPLLIEVGISFKEIQKALKFRVSDIAGCLITHEHQDHCKAVHDLVKAGIDCYMSQGTAEALGIKGHRVNMIKAKQQFNIGSWTVLPFDAEHDAAEPLGFLMASNGAKLIYLTDSYFCRYRFRELTHIMIEANYSMDILKANMAAGNLPKELKTRILRSHFSLENVKEFLRTNDLIKVEQIWLLHLSDGNSDAGRFKREIQELTGKPVYIA